MPDLTQEGLAARGLRVKPLAWFEAELPSRGGGKYTAEGYTIRRIEGLWLLDFAGNGKAAWRWVDLAAAKAAAQVDYETRIRSALEDTGEPALIREAEARNRDLMLDALAALVSARDTIRRKWATTNPERERVINALSDALGLEVVPAAAHRKDEETPK